jgi:uncharacterized membrane protein
MPVVKGSITIDRPIQDVFEFIADQAKTTQWCLALAECELTTDGELAEGSERVVARKMLGMSFKWTYDCESFKPPTHIAWRSVGGRLPMLDYYDLTEQGDSTLVEHTADIEKMGVLRLLQPIMRRKGEKDLNKDLVALKALMEPAS